MPWAELEIKPRLQSKKEVPPGPPSRCKKEWIRCSQITTAGYGYTEDTGTLPSMVTERVAVKGASKRRYWLKYGSGKSKEKQKMPEVKKSIEQKSEAITYREIRTYVGPASEKWPYLKDTKVKGWGGRTARNQEKEKPWKISSICQKTPRRTLKIQPRVRGKSKRRGKEEIPGEINRGIYRKPQKSQLEKQEN